MCMNDVNQGDTCESVYNSIHRHEYIIDPVVHTDFKMFTGVAFGISETRKKNRAMSKYKVSQPVRKKGRFKRESPFPVPIESITGRPASVDNW